MVSNKLNGFLEGFQTGKPMIPFMTDVPGDIIQDFLDRIILKVVFRKANTIYKLIQVKPQDKNIRKRPKIKTKQQAGEFLAKL